MRRGGRLSRRSRGEFGHPDCCAPRRSWIAPPAVAPRDPVELVDRGTSIRQTKPRRSQRPRSLRGGHGRVLCLGAVGHSNTRMSSRSRPSAFGNGAATSSSLDGCDPRRQSQALSASRPSSSPSRCRNRYASTIDLSGEYSPIVQPPPSAMTSRPSSNVAGASHRAPGPRRSVRQMGVEDVCRTTISEQGRPAGRPCWRSRGSWLRTSEVVRLRSARRTLALVWKSGYTSTPTRA